MMKSNMKKAYMLKVQPEGSPKLSPTGNKTIMENSTHLLPRIVAKTQGLVKSR